MLFFRRVIQCARLVTAGSRKGYMYNLIPTGRKVVSTIWDHDFQVAT